MNSRKIQRRYSGPIGISLMVWTFMGLLWVAPLAAKDGSEEVGKTETPTSSKSQTPGSSQAAAASSAPADLAKQAQNPIAKMISLPLQNNTNFGIGETDRIQNTLLIQPVIPFALGGSVNLIARTIVPVVRQPIGEDDSKNGLGDINFTAFLSPAKSSKLIWGVGPSLMLKSATDDALGTGKWSAGPSLVALTMPGPWVLGALVSNVWSYAGDSDREAVNSFSLQYFINYNLKKGWYLSSTPTIASNWKAGAGDKWVIPFGGGLGRVFHVGKQPVNASARTFWNAKHPEQGASWTLQLQLTFLFPK